MRTLNSQEVTTVAAGYDVVCDAFGCYEVYDPYYYDVYPVYPVFIDPVEVFAATLVTCALVVFWAAAVA